MWRNKIGPGSTGLIKLTGLIRDRVKSGVGIKSKLNCWGGGAGGNISRDRILERGKGI